MKLSRAVLALLFATAAPAWALPPIIQPVAPGVGTTAGTVAAGNDSRIPDIINVVNAGIIADGVTDQHAKLQALFDANPTGTIQFPRASGCVISNGTILLSDSTGRNFSGKIQGAGGCISFSNAGNTTDADIASQRGFAAYPKTNALYGDNTGISFVQFERLTINGPANGIGAYVANSYGVVFKDNTFSGSRWNIVNECDINTTFEHNNFASFVNAGVGLLYLADTARVWYGSASATIGSYWNDSPTFSRNAFGGGTVGGLAMVVDHGSNAEAVRQFNGNTFISTGAGGIQYAYLARKANAHFTADNWFEGINYPIRILSINSVEGGSTFAVPGVTAAQPSGTYTLANFPDGYSQTAMVMGSHFVGAINDIDVSGVNGGTSVIGANLSQGHTGYHITTSQGGSISDLGDALAGGAASYVYHPYASYFSLAATAPTASPSFTGTIGITGTNGTATFQGPNANGWSVLTANQFVLNGAGGIMSYGAGGVSAQSPTFGAILMTPPTYSNGAATLSTYGTTGGLNIVVSNLAWNQNAVLTSGASLAGGAIVPFTVTTGAYAYTATARGTVFVSGGTVSSITIKRGSTTIQTGVLAGGFDLWVGDVLTINNTVAPTANFIPS